MQTEELEAALAAATTSVAALEYEKSTLSQDEKALGERVSSLEGTIRALEDGKTDLEEKLAALKEQSAKTVDEVSLYCPRAEFWILFDISLTRFNSSRHRLSMR